jgi:ArsR family transcriptional regulator
MRYGDPVGSIDRSTRVEITPSMSCCTPLLATPLDAAEAEAMASLLKALADPVRLQLLSLIATAPDGEVCVCDLVAPVGRSQPTVSHHLAVLVDAGVLARDKRGRWAWFRVVPERLDTVRDLFRPVGARA